MYDDLFPRERATSLSESIRRPYTPPTGPGAFGGFGSALADVVPNAVLTTGNAWSGILDAYGKAAAYRDAPAAAMLAGRPAPDMGQLQSQTIDQIGNNQLGPQLRKEAKRYTPDPQTAGTAGQIVFGVGTSLAKAGAYSLTGPAAPALFGLDLGVNRADELKDQGVNTTTANVAGAITGVAGGLGLRLPAALGATRLQSAAIGAALNPALNVAELGGIQLLLKNADYAKIAAQYQPFDPVNLAVAAVTGAAFGAAFHRGRSQVGDAVPPEAGTPETDVRLTPDEHAAVLTMHEVRVRDADTLTPAADVPAANAARDAQLLARQQMDAGEPVSVAARVPTDPQVVSAAVRATFDRAALELGARSPDELATVLQATSPAADVVGGNRATGDTPLHPLPANPPANAGQAMNPVVEQVVDAVSRLLGREDAPVLAGLVKADTPEQNQAFSLAARNPDAMLPTGELNPDGTPVLTRFSDLVQQAANLEKQARAESVAYKAAVDCAVRFPRSVRNPDIVRPTE